MNRVVGRRRLFHMLKRLLVLDEGAWEVFLLNVHVEES